MTSHTMNDNVHHWSSPCWLGFYQEGLNKSILEKYSYHKRILEPWLETTKKTITQLASGGTSHHHFWVISLKINKYLE